MLPAWARNGGGSGTQPHKPEYCHWLLFFRASGVFSKLTSAARPRPRNNLAANDITIPSRQSLVPPLHIVSSSQSHRHFANSEPLHCKLQRHSSKSQLHFPSAKATSPSSVPSLVDLCLPDVTPTAASRPASLPACQ